MSEVKLAVIGVGRMGTNHVRVLSEMENVRLLAVCDANREAAEKVARRFLVPAVYTEIEELAGGEELDGVVIAIPTAEHLLVAGKCVKHKLHAFVFEGASGVDGE